MNRIALFAAALSLAALTGAAQAQMYDPNNPSRLVDPNAARGMLGQDQQRQESLRSLQNQQQYRARDHLDNSSRQRMDSERRTQELLSGDRGTRPVDRDAVQREQQRAYDNAQKEREARERLDRLSPPKLPGE
jgi:hypothetical protein